MGLEAIAERPRCVEGDLAGVLMLARVQSHTYKVMAAVGLSSIAKRLDFFLRNDLVKGLVEHKLKPS